MRLQIYHQSSLVDRVVKQLRLELVAAAIGFTLWENLSQRSHLVLATAELSPNSRVPNSDSQSLEMIRLIPVNQRTFLAELLESATMDVRPASRAPYVNCASGCRSLSLGHLQKGRTHGFCHFAKS